MPTANPNAAPMRVTADTRIGDVLARYGDVADVMETLGVKRVARYDLRKLLAKALTVRRAAVVHRLDLEEMITRLQAAINRVHAGQADVGDAR